MRAITRRQPDANRDRWMVSYMDVLTILLIFFVAATAQTMIPPPPATVPLLSKPVPRPQNKLEALHLDLTRDPRGWVISLPQTVLFGSGNDTIAEPAFPMVERIAAVLREIPNKVILVGHADAVPIHNKRFKNNWELAAARSLRLLELLAHNGIDESRLSVASYSSFNPKDSNDTPDGRASNRRVEIIILDEL
jgi:flagellar motor protein MotB